VDVLADRYEIVRSVSEGRRATVLQALDRQHERLVALKVYPVVDEEDRDELLAEARVLLGTTPHPGLPVVRGDFFVDDPRRYVVVMDWIDGVDLQHVLDETGDPGLPFREVLEDVTQVAAAIDHLHAHDPPIVHGDVKPANLVRTPPGKVVLVDFDIAGAASGAGRVGTRGFVAPEVAAGEKPTPAADVYGLAATVVALLNGQAPTLERPAWPGIDPAETGQLARVLRTALSVDPAARPPSAGHLVARLRDAARADLPTGTVTFLATEVADAGLLWDDDEDEMRAAMTRLNDLLSGVVESTGGRIVSSMNEGDRTIAVFRDRAAAVRAAVTIQERVDARDSVVGASVRLRVAVDVGEAELVDGAYAGAAVDRVLWLRSIAAPGAVITSRATADLARDSIDDDVTIVDLATVATRSRSRDTAICGFARPGREHTARLDPAALGEPQPSDRAATPVVAATQSSRRQLVQHALGDSVSLGAITVGGLALIYLFVLGSELGGTTFALVVLALSSAVLLVNVVFRYSVSRLDEDADRERAAIELEHSVAEEKRQSELAATRRALADGFDRIGAETASRSLAGLTDQYDALMQSLRGERHGAGLSLAVILPGLAEETYATGLGALTQALGLLEVANSPKGRRVARELREVEERLAADAVDERERERDRQRKVAAEETLAALEELRDGARELLFQAERCEVTLHRSTIELASVRAGSAHVSVDSVIETLEANIRRVREVQVELRKLQY
jgi:hypothetical protein